jgi:hypothetical protein
VQYALMFMNIDTGEYQLDGATATAANGLDALNELGAAGWQVEAMCPGPPYNWLSFTLGRTL